MIRVIVADDQLIVRERVKQVVSEASDIFIVGEAADGQQLLQLVQNCDCDIVLLDIDMPVKSGIATLKELKHERPEIPVIVLSMYPEKQYAVRTIKAGASGYLTKAKASDELIEAIRKVVQGENYMGSLD